MNTTPETQRYLDAANAVRIVDERGTETREQSAIAYLHEAGYYVGLTVDEARHLDAMVREACETIMPQRISPARLAEIEAREAATEERLVTLGFFGK